MRLEFRPSGIKAMNLRLGNRFGGRRAVAGRAVAVEAIDRRPGARPTPIAGVIGADVLRGFVLDVSFAPCRVRRSPAGRARAFPARWSLPLSWLAERPVVSAAVADGP